MRKTYYKVGDMVQIKKYLEAKIYYSYDGLISDTVVSSMQNCAGQFTRIDAITDKHKYVVSCDNHTFGWVDGMFEKGIADFYKEV